MLDIDGYFADRGLDPDDFTEKEKGKITARLNEAAEIIKSFTNGGWESPSGSEVIANGVQAAMVQRYYDNPDGITGETQDGVGYTAASSLGEVAGQLDMTSKEMVRLLRAGIKKSARIIGTIDFTRNGGRGAW